METKSAAKVGAVVLVGMALLIAMYFYLSHSNPNTYTLKVSFANTKGLSRQSEVRMRGVRIGEVKDVDMNTNEQPMRPIATLSIEKRYTIPSDSKFVIVSGILITNPQVEIIPGTKETVILANNADVIPGEEGGGALAALSPELDETVKTLKSSVQQLDFKNLNDKLNKSYAKIDRILDQAGTLLETTNKAAATGQKLISDPTVQRNLRVTLQNFKDASDEVKVTSSSLGKELRGVIRSSRGTFDKLTASLSNLLTRVDTTLDDANTIVKRLTDQVTDPRLQNTLQETADLARTTLARFNQIASDLHQITGDPQLQNNLKATVQNLQDASEKGEAAIGKIDALLGRLTGKAGEASQIKLPQVEIVGNLSEQFNPSRFRADVEARISTGDRNLLNLGLYDLGDNTRLILQGGTRYTPQFMARYGLYASKLGVGAEYNTNSGVGFRADLWDANRPRLDFRTLFRVNKNASIWLGADGLFQNDPTPRIGIQYSP
jgi:phospholipid/cholesterol/gamma-HCH transport system substrate-binding protein